MFSVVLTCSSVPSYMEVIEGDDKMTVGDALNIINKKCPVKHGYNVWLDGELMDGAMGTRIALLLGHDSSPTVYICRRDCGVLTEKDIQKVKEMRAFLGQLIGEYGTAHDDTEASKNIENILDFVTQNEDAYYAKLTCGENPIADLQYTASAVAFQKVRYFIELMLEQQ